MKATFDDIKSSAIIAFHDRSLESEDRPVSGAARYIEGPFAFVEKDHRFNARLWDEEDLARRRAVSDAEIVANKRSIDAYNQARNDAVERLDGEILRRLKGVMNDNARLHSETPGMMIDRLSILALKIRAMRAQTERKDMGGTHVSACITKLARLVEQRVDLANCLDELLADCLAGRARFKAYRQYKMYNDPELNPHLRGE
jgi:hypothetical protein